MTFDDQDDLRAQVQHDKRREQNEALDDRDPNKEFED